MQKHKHHIMYMYTNMLTNFYSVDYNVGDLLDVYRKFMQNEGWQVSMIDSSTGDDGGYKNVVLEVKGDSVYSKLKW